MKNQALISQIENDIKKDGYVVLNVQDTYFYTVGFGEQGKNDLFGLSHYPFGMFQVIASKYAAGEIQQNKGFALPEYKIPGNGVESVRSKLKPLSLQTNTLIQSALAKASEDFNTQGFSFVMGPDKDNLLAGEEGCALNYEPNELIQKFVVGVKEDLDRAINEAQQVRMALGIK